MATMERRRMEPPMIRAMGDVKVVSCIRGSILNYKKLWSRG
jgi:hypothetical protein